MLRVGNETCTAELDFDDSNVVGVRATDVQAAGSGERVANPGEPAFASSFSAFYRAHGDFVHAIALRTVRHSDAAEDVSQEVFVKVWTRPSTFDPNRGSVRTWLRILTRSAAIARLRRDSAIERRDRTNATDQARLLRAVSAEDDALTTLRHDAVRRAIAQLPPTRRVAIELAYIDGMTYREVALLTQTPEGTVKSRIRAGLKRLAVTLDQPTH